MLCKATITKLIHAITGLHFHELESNERKLFWGMIKLSFEYLKHRIYTNGFLFEENRQKKTERMQFYEIDKHFKHKKNGKDVTDGR
jgi:hypothetical protein